MDKLFDSHWALRVVALILAILLFFYAKAQIESGQSTSINPEMDIITNVPLEAYYDSENLIVSGLPETVDVKIEGPVQIVIEAKLRKDFKVFVDLNSLLIGEHRVTIQHENFSEKLDVTIDPKVVDIVIEEKVTKEVSVDPELNNGRIAEGYELVGMSTEPDTVLVTGAKSIIDKISYVKATINAEDGINASFEQEANVKVLDSSLNKLDVAIEPATVNVKVDVRAYSREIPIVIRQTGTPMEGVTINSLTSKIKTIEVFGPKTMIDPLTQLEVEFDVSEIKESGVYDVDLVLPNGATRLSAKSIEVQANVTKKTTEPEEETPEEPEEEQPTTGETNTGDTNPSESNANDTNTGETDTNQTNPEETPSDEENTTE